MNQKGAMNIFYGIILGTALFVIIFYVRHVCFTGFIEKFSMPMTLSLGFNMCGVGMPSCNKGMRCINGYCTNPTQPFWPSKSDLPLRGPSFSPEGEWVRLDNYTTMK